MSNDKHLIESKNRVKSKISRKSENVNKSKRPTSFENENNRRNSKMLPNRENDNSRRQSKMVNNDENDNSKKQSKVLSNVENGNIRRSKVSNNVDPEILLNSKLINNVGNGNIRNSKRLSKGENGNIRNSKVLSNIENENNRRNSKMLPNSENDNSRRQIKMISEGENENTRRNSKIANNGGNENIRNSKIANNGGNENIRNSKIVNKGENGKIRNSKLVNNGENGKIIKGKYSNTIGPEIVKDNTILNDIGNETNIRNARWNNVKNAKWTNVENEKRKSYTSTTTSESTESSTKSEQKKVDTSETESRIKNIKPNIEENTSPTNTYEQCQDEDVMQENRKESSIFCNDKENCPYKCPLDIKHDYIYRKSILKGSPQNSALDHLYEYGKTYDLGSLISVNCIKQESTSKINEVSEETARNEMKHPFCPDKENCDEYLNCTEDHCGCDEMMVCREFIYTPMSESLSSESISDYKNCTKPCNKGFGRFDYSSLEYSSDGDIFKKNIITHEYFSESSNHALSDWSSIRNFSKKKSSRRSVSSRRKRKSKSDKSSIITSSERQSMIRKRIRKYKKSKKFQKQKEEFDCDCFLPQCRQPCYPDCYNPFYPSCFCPELPNYCPELPGYCPDLTNFCPDLPNFCPDFPFCCPDLPCSCPMHPYFCCPPSQLNPLSQPPPPPPPKKPPPSPLTSINRSNANPPPVKIQKVPQITKETQTIQKPPSPKIAPKITPEISSKLLSIKPNKSAAIQTEPEKQVSVSKVDPSKKAASDEILDYYIDVINDCCGRVKKVNVTTKKPKTNKNCRICDRSDKYLAAAMCKSKPIDKKDQGKENFVSRLSTQLQFKYFGNSRSLDKKDFSTELVRKKLQQMGASKYISQNVQQMSAIENIPQNVKQMGASAYAPENVQPTRSSGYVPGNFQQMGSSAYPPENVQQMGASAYAPQNVQQMGSSAYSPENVQLMGASAYAPENVQQMGGSAYVPENVQQMSAREYASQNVQQLGSKNYAPQNAQQMGTNECVCQNVQQMGPNGQDVDSFRRCSPFCLQPYSLPRCNFAVPMCNEIQNKPISNVIKKPSAPCFCDSALNVDNEKCREWVKENCIRDVPITSSFFEDNKGSFATSILGSRTNMETFEEEFGGSGTYEGSENGDEQLSKKTKAGDFNAKKYFSEDFESRSFAKPGTNDDTIEQSSVKTKDEKLGNVSKRLNNAAQPEPNLDAIQSKHSKVGAASQANLAAQPALNLKGVKSLYPEVGTKSKINVGAQSGLNLEEVKSVYPQIAARSKGDFGAQSALNLKGAKSLYPNEPKSQINSEASKIKSEPKSQMGYGGNKKSIKFPLQVNPQINYGGNKKSIKFPVQVEPQANFGGYKKSLKFPTLMNKKSLKIPLTKKSVIPRYDKSVVDIKKEISRKPTQFTPIEDDDDDDEDDDDDDDDDDEDGESNANGNHSRSNKHVGEGFHSRRHENFAQNNLYPNKTRPYTSPVDITHKQFRKKHRHKQDQNFNSFAYKKVSRTPSRTLIPNYNGMEYSNKWRKVVPSSHMKNKIMNRNWSNQKKTPTITESVSSNRSDEKKSKYCDINKIFAKYNIKRSRGLNERKKYSMNTSVSRSIRVKNKGEKEMKATMNFYDDDSEGQSHGTKGRKRRNLENVCSNASKREKLCLKENKSSRKINKNNSVERILEKWKSKPKKRTTKLLSNVSSSPKISNIKNKTKKIKLVEESDTKLKSIKNKQFSSKKTENMKKNIVKNDMQTPKKTKKVSRLNNNKNAKKISNKCSSSQQATKKKKTVKGSKIVEKKSNKFAEKCSQSDTYSKKIKNIETKLAKKLKAFLSTESLDHIFTKKFIKTVKAADQKKKKTTKIIEKTPKKKNKKCIEKENKSDTKISIKLKCKKNKKQNEALLKDFILSLAKDKIHSQKKKPHIVSYAEPFGNGDRGMYSGLKTEAFNDLTSTYSGPYSSRQQFSAISLYEKKEKLKNEISKVNSMIHKLYKNS